MHFNPLPHRIESLPSYKGVKYINDSKSTTIASTIAALECFDDIILILGGELKGEMNIKELLNCINHKSIKSIIIYGHVSQLLENELKIPRGVDFCYGFNEAINRALELSSSGDSVLLSPGFSSFDQFKNYKERGNTFKKIIKEINGSQYAK